MHTDSGRSERIFWWKHESSPILTVLIGRLWRASENVMPSRYVSSSRFREGRRGYSRILVSEGCAMMYGGGFSWMALYSRASCNIFSMPLWIEGGNEILHACWQLEMPYLEDVSRVLDGKRVGKVLGLIKSERVH